MNEVVDDPLPEMGCAFADRFGVVTNPNNSGYVLDFKITASETGDRNTSTVQECFSRAASERDNPARSETFEDMQKERAAGSQLAQESGFPWIWVMFHH